MKLFPIILQTFILLLTACNSTSEVSSLDETIRNDAATVLNINLSGSLQNPAFIKNGKAIVFTRFRDGYNKGASDLYTYDLESEELVSLISDNNSNVNLPGSSWNNSTHSVVFSSDQNPHDEIFTLADSGKSHEKQQVTNRRDKQSFEPTFSPNGEWVVFESHDIDKEDGGVITKYKIDGSSNYINLTAPEDNCKQPNWSPRGDKILYQKQTEERWDIWTMNIDGSNSTPATSSDKSSTDAVFSVDGESIIYSAENNNGNLSNIYQTSLSTKETQQITDYIGYDGAPSISPNNKKVIFESSEVNPDSSAGTKIWLIDINY